MLDSFKKAKGEVKANQTGDPTANVEFAIDKGVEKRPRQKTLMYPFDKMGVNDSFVIAKSSANSCRSSSLTFRKREGNGDMKFSVGPDKKGIMRCWRDR